RKRELELNYFARAVVNIRLAAQVCRARPRIREALSQEAWKSKEENATVIAKIGRFGKRCRSPRL
ncbi:MAG: hypothetical protein WBZ23_14600, partial [Pseudolabrys sp.]